MEQNTILQKISNAVIANLSNTDGIGFLHGETGVILYLYKYSSYTKKQLYADIADFLIDKVFERMNDAIPARYDRGLAGIGCGMCRMLQEGYIEGTPSLILEDFDAHLLGDIEKILDEDLVSDYPVYSSGLYLLERLRIEEMPFMQRLNLINKIIEPITKIQWKRIENSPSELLFISSIIYVLINLSDLVLEKQKIDRLYSNLLEKVMQILQRKNDYHAILLQNIVPAFPQYTTLFQVEKDFLVKKELEWFLLFGTPLSYQTLDWNLIVDKILMESEFNIFTVNSDLVKIGTYLIEKKRNTNL